MTHTSTVQSTARAYQLIYSWVGLLGQHSLQGIRRLHCLRSNLCLRDTIDYPRRDLRCFYVWIFEEGAEHYFKNRQSYVHVFISPPGPW